MSTPKVTELLRKPEPVGHDPFIDDLPTERSSARERRGAGATLWPMMALQRPESELIPA